MKILLTGATGFIGSALLAALGRSRAGDILATCRDQSRVFSRGILAIPIADMGQGVDWNAAIAGVEVIIHAAGLTHVSKADLAGPLTAYRKVNVADTLNLARQAATAGVRRFIFLSSIKVHGEETLPGIPFTANDTPAPADPYGLSKLEAELGLQELARETGMEVVIIRPPLVYGPGAKGNFKTLITWIDRGIPLPLGAIDNKRSLIALDNLVDFILTCIDHPQATNQTFLVADGEDLSTPELLRRVGHCVGKPACLLRVPVRWLKAGAVILGKQDMAQRLCGNLQVDMAKTRQLLRWNPPVSVDEGLRRAVGNL